MEQIHSTTEAAKCRARVVQDKRLKESCQDFEALLTGFLFKAMRQSIVRSDEHDPGTDLYESMVDEAVAKEMSREEKIGLSRLLYQSLSPQVSKPGSGK